MDPARMTLLAAGAGTLLAVVIVGPIAVFSVLNDPGGEAGGAAPLQETRMGMPAAQEAFAQGLRSEDAAYLNDRMEMMMEMTGAEGVLFGEAVVRMDPHSGDHQFHMMFDIAAINEAYGIEEEEDEFEDALFFFFPEAEDISRFEFGMTKSGPMHAISLGGNTWAWRDHSPSDEAFTLFPEEDPNEVIGDPKETRPPMNTDELQRFMEADESMVVHEIEASEFEGTPTWMVRSTLHEDDVEGEAVFHFRQSDMAPLAIDMTMHGLFEEGLFDFVMEQNPSAEPMVLEDFELGMKMRFTYGSSVQVEFPLEYSRVAVSVAAQEERTPTMIQRTLTPGHNEMVPLEDLELHLVVVDEWAVWEDPFAGPAIVETLAKHDLAQGLEGTDGVFHFEYEDLDGDGFISSGDRFRVTTDLEDAFWENMTHRVSLLVYDNWADAYEGAPAPAMVWLLVLVAGAVWSLRRRRLRGETR